MQSVRATFTSCIVTVALAIHKAVLGAHHPDTARSLNNLAGLYEAQGDLAAALPLVDRALAICERAWGRQHPTTRTIRGYLGYLLAQTGGRWRQG